MPVGGASAIYLDGPWSHRPVSANGTRFHIAESGEGPLALMLHGLSAVQENTAPLGKITPSQLSAEPRSETLAD